MAQQNLRPVLSQLIMPSKTATKKMSEDEAQSEPVRSFEFTRLLIKEFRDPYVAESFAIQARYIGDEERFRRISIRKEIRALQLKYAEIVSNSMRPKNNLLEDEKAKNAREDMRLRIIDASTLHFQSVFRRDKVIGF